MTDSHKWQMLALGVLVAALLYLLAPVLTPFAVSALLAYLGDPLVDRLERHRLSRTLSVTIVFLIMTAAMLQFPVLDMARDPAANYGALGALVAHELTHAVDGSGRGTKCSSSGGTTRGSGVTSITVSRISAPDTPSIAAWWILE